MSAHDLMDALRQHRLLADRSASTCDIVDGPKGFDPRRDDIDVWHETHDADWCDPSWYCGAYGSGATPLPGSCAAVVTALGMIMAMVGATALTQSARPADVYVAPGPSHSVYCPTSWDAGGCALPNALIGLVTTSVGSDAP